MKLLTMVGDILISRTFWIMRTLTLVASLLIIWRYTMSDFVLYTPVEYLPVLLGIAIVITLFMTYIKATVSYQDWLKEHLKDGTITTKVAYAMDYLTADIVSVVAVIILAIVIPGAVYEALGAPAGFAGCVLIDAFISFVGGWGGVTLLHKVIDSFRNKDKINALLKQE